MRINSSLYSLIYIKEKKSFLLFDIAEHGYAYYKNYRIDLISGDKQSFGIDLFKKQLADIKLVDKFDATRIINLQYEYSSIETQSDDTLLAIDLKFSDSQIYIPKDDNRSLTIKALDHIDLSEYEDKFNQVYKHLVDGNSYQVNLTSQFEFECNQNDPQLFIDKLWRNDLVVGEYAHCIYTKHLDRLFLSNSPECLFDYDAQNKEIISRPIKGTVKINDCADMAWSELKNSQKDQAELYMITDLMRNDLTKLELNPSRVEQTKARLDVPGLVHSYSLLKTKTSDDLSLKRIIDCLFPGGSITGAPKTKTMQLIAQIENKQRGLYCGSTIVLHDQIIKASINIRSATIDTKSGQLRYGSGGGVTLLSNANDEYKESLSKVASFIENFQDI